jgi:hypothetical protein
MTEKLYGAPDLCVRELLQNGLDALRYRTALFRLEPAIWSAGEVHFEHGLDEHGVEFLSCTDNGVGMDEEVICKFLTKVGRSYYRSPLFEQERRRFRQAGVDFDPCSRFGIGFMSSFMLGDQIVIETRRDYGPGKKLGEPWHVEIQGLSSIVTLRRGKATQPAGTKVTIALRGEAPAFDLVGTLKTFALATEYPISAKCCLPDRRADLQREPGIQAPPTFLEAMGVTQIARFERDLGALDGSGLCQGSLRKSFLIDERGRLALSNKEAEWLIHSGSGFDSTYRSVSVNESFLSTGTKLRLGLANGRKAKMDEAHLHEPICADGIWVGDRQGAYRHVHDSLIIDTRGQKKPELTPARTLIQSGAAWQSIYELLQNAERSIWEEILASVPERLDQSTFWALIELDNFRVEDLPMGLIWEKLALPVEDAFKVTGFRPVREIRMVVWNRQSPYGFVSDNGETLNMKGHQIVYSLSELDVEDGRLHFSVRAPANGDATARAPYLAPRCYGVPFGVELRSALLAYDGQYFVNLNHPLIARYAKQPFSGDPVSKFTHDLLSSDPAVSEPYLVWLKERRKAGNQFKQIQWQALPSGFRPPYRIFVEREGWIELRAEDLEQWAAIDVPDED